MEGLAEEEDERWVVAGGDGSWNDGCNNSLRLSE